MKWHEDDTPTGAELAKFDQIEAQYTQIVTDAVNIIRGNELFKPTESNRMIGVMAFLTAGGLEEIDPQILVMYLATALIKLADAPETTMFEFGGVL